MPTDVRGWIVSVAYNLFRDERRRVTRRRRLLASRTPDTTMADAPEAADEMVLRLEREAVVRRALDALAPRDRALLLLRYEGYSYVELASAIRVAPGSVGTLLARATAAFKESLERDAHDAE